MHTAAKLVTEHAHTSKHVHIWTRLTVSGSVYSIRAPTLSMYTPMHEYSSMFTPVCAHARTHGRSHWHCSEDRRRIFLFRMIFIGESTETRQSETKKGGVY